MSVTTRRLVSAIVIVAALVGVSAMRVNLPAQEALGSNKPVTALAYYRFAVVPDSIVYDIWDLDYSTSQAGVMGGFFRFAQKLKDREFREVRLAYRGKTKFVLGGDDFAEIGRTLEYQNPVYIYRTFPEKLRDPDGSRSFPGWTGGLIGVLGGQLDDMNKVGRRWYLDDWK